MSELNEVKDKILDIINENIDNTDIIPDQMDEDLSVLGMDSITFIRIVVKLEEVFDIEVPDEYLLITEMNTVTKMVKVITDTLNCVQ